MASEEKTASSALRWETTETHGCKEERWVQEKLQGGNCDLETELPNKVRVEDLDLVH